MSDANPGYLDVASIARRVAVGTPHHVAVHRIDDVDSVPAGYSVPHAHDDLTELNILLPDGDGLTYSMVLGEGDEVLVDGPCVVVIPPGVAHSANVARGRGWFVVVRFRGADEPSAERRAQASSGGTRAAKPSQSRSTR